MTLTPICQPASFVFPVGVGHSFVDRSVYWTQNYDAEIDRPLIGETSGSAPRSKGAELEQQIARFIESLGYDVRTNVVLEGRSGSRHEIDVLGEKHDALSTFRVAVECKAWDQPIEKDVIAKFSYVLQDLGLREGIMVALGGSRSGATTAAAELGITLWGPEEISERLGAVGLADLRTQAPRHEATGFPVVTDLQGAEAFFQREARGTLGFGAETIAWTSLVWLPVSVVQVALSRTGGRIKKVTQTRRIWNSYDRIGGSHLGRWSTQPPLTSVDIANSSLSHRSEWSHMGGPSGPVPPALHEWIVRIGKPTGVEAALNIRTHSSSIGP